jgi:hypothetical protein
MIIIIGAGISGLYLGHLLQKQGKDFIILEQQQRYGGRVYVESFDDERIVIGAGIGRFKKDKILYDLCTSLDVPVHKYTSQISRVFSKQKVSDKKFIDELKQLASIRITKEKRSTTDFLTFLKENQNLDFINLSGYTDYIHADIIDTIEDYGFDDVISGYTGFSIDWDDLLDKLYNSMSDKIYVGEGIIEHIEKDKSVRTNKRVYRYDQLVCTVPVSIARLLFPSIKILDDLDVQPFSRIYVKIDKGKKEMAEIKNFTIVDSYLRKIIPINPKKGIYMIGYNDNGDALKSFSDFRNLTEKEVYDKIRYEINRIFGIDMTIGTSKIAFWEYGTTYYKPLKTKYKNRGEWLKIAQNPLSDIYFVGEGFSRNQGWVEGALESVDAIVGKFK